MGDRTPEPLRTAGRVARRIVGPLIRPIERFLKIEAASGILLLAMAVIALLWANSPWSGSYEHLWHTPLPLGDNRFHLNQPLHFWVNEALMVLFFLVAGLEIRREMHAGELSDLARAALPAVAAIGGMVVPAAIYLAFNRAPEVHSGWGTPMATDIAFAVGILALLGNRVPSALRVLLLALAIIDDIGAIVVIALFYSGNVALEGLGVTLAGVVVVLGMQRLRIDNAWAYVPAGVVVWIGMLVSGVHPAIAGVLLGLLTPAVPSRRNAPSASAPVVRVEQALHPYVAYGIMPLFALANAGVPVDSVDFSAAHAPGLAAGVALGLAVGKPVGIVGASLLATRLGLCALPRRVDARGLFVVGAVGGIGFTMALFIAELAFSTPAELGVAKLAVLGGSFIAGIVGIGAGLLLLPKPDTPDVSLQEAEQSTEL